MGSEVELRPVDPSDAGLLFRVYAGTREDVLQAPLSDDERAAFLQMQFAAQQSDYAARFPNSEHSVIVVDGVDVGRIWIDRGVEEIRLLDIALLPGERNRGTGMELLKRLIAEAQEAQLPLRHSVFTTNGAALRFYARLGFEVVEDFGMYVLMEWKGRATKTG